MTSFADSDIRYVGIRYVTLRTQAYLSIMVRYSGIALLLITRLQMPIDKVGIGYLFSTYTLTLPFPLSYFYDQKALCTLLASVSRYLAINSTSKLIIRRRR